MGEVVVEVIVDNKEELQGEIDLLVERIGPLVDPRDGITNSCHPKLFLIFLELGEKEGINVFNIILHASSWKFTPASGTFSIPIKVNLDPGFVEFLSTVTIERYGDGPQEFNLVFG